MSPNPVIVRAATTADAAAIASLLAELGYPTDAASIRPRLTGVLAEGGAAFLAVDGADGAVGFLSLAKHVVVHAPAPVALITALVIAQSARGQGTGRALVATARTWAQSAGCGRLAVTSAERRADAHAFYPACGLPYTGRRFATSIEPAT